MPMPKPKPDETQDAFVERCMGDETMNSEYPDQEQRAAVCIAQFGKAKDAQKAKALTHNSTLADEEPDWEKIDKTQLPLKAFAWDAPGTEEDQKATWKYPHHFVMNGTMNDDGVFVDGDMYLHRGGLNAAWAAAQGARSGEKAPAAVIAHLNAHRIDLDKGETGKSMTKTFYKRATTSGVEVVYDEATGAGTISGYASVWDVVDQQGDIMRKGAFAKTIKERVASGKVPLMIRHFAHGGDISDAIGEIVSAKEDDYGLHITAKLYSTQSAQESRVKVMASPKMYGLSVGFSTTKKGATEIDSGYEFNDVILYEVTLTATPAVLETNAEAKAEANLGEKFARMEAELESVRAQLAKIMERAPDNMAESKATVDHANATGDTATNAAVIPPRRNIARSLRRRVQRARMEVVG